MARPLRIEFPGAIYHVTSRGNAQASIFLDDIGRSAFLAVLGLTMRRFNVICHAYCLMTNHFHLLLETPDANLSKAMRQFNSVYTQAFNRRHGRVGHVLQGRFKSIVVDRDAYLLELCRYIVLNPVRAGMVKEPWLSTRGPVTGLRQVSQRSRIFWLWTGFWSSSMLIASRPGKSTVSLSSQALMRSHPGMISKDSACSETTRFWRSSFPCSRTKAP
jgi:REP element-mobilizing transposase RayT